MNAAHISAKLDACLIESRILLGTAKLLDSASKDSPAFNDPRYFPFYYHLGKHVEVKRVAQIGPVLGLPGACFLQGRRGVEEWYAMLPSGSTQPATIIVANLKRYMSGLVNVYCVPAASLDNDSKPDRPYDLALLTEKFEPEVTAKYLNYLWNGLSSEGLLVVDYIHDDAVKGTFDDFCRVKNRKPDVFKTRYGVGVLTR